MVSAAFTQKVKTFGPRFMSDLGLKAHHVAGMFGNFAVETGEFKYRTEIAPTVKGSKGGIGWAQWTGYGKMGRRKPFEDFVKAKGHNLTTENGYDEACYAFVVYELRGTEKAALTALKRTTTPEAAAETFCKRYERPGVPHLAKRAEYAAEAMKALSKASSVLNKPVTLVSSTPLGGAPDITYDRFKRGVVYQELLDLQPKLKAKGYYTSGDIDGKWGRMTRNAILAFQADNGLPLTGEYSADLAAAVSISDPVTQPAERALATVDTPAVLNSPVVQASLAVRVKTWWGKVISGTVAVVMGIWSMFSELLPSAEQFRGYFDFPPAVWFGLIAVGAAGWFFYSRAVGKDAKKVPEAVAASYQAGGAA